MKRRELLNGLAALAVASAHAQQPASADHNNHHIQARTASDVSASMTAGEVRKVDRDAGKLTLRHGPIPNLEMPEMTMVFRVVDPRMLDGLEPTDKVRFTADRIGGQITVTHLEAAE